MENLQLRGYVRPEDFEPDCADSVQKALDLAEKLDIRKVVLRGKYETDRTLFVPGGMEIVLKKGAVLSITNDAPLLMNRVANEEGKNSWAFEDSRIYLKGEEDSLLKGDLSFYHAKYVTLDHISLNGSVFFEFCREIRMEYDTISSERDAVTLGRGCNNFIMQYLSVNGNETAFRIDTKEERGPYVIGKDAEIHEIILRDSELNGKCAVALGASEEYGIFNAQIDHIRTNGSGIVIGDGNALPKKRFFNITAMDFTAAKEALVLKNETHHCYFGE